MVSPYSVCGHSEKHFSSILQDRVMTGSASVVKRLGQGLLDFLGLMESKLQRKREEKHAEPHLVSPLPSSAEFYIMSGSDGLQRECGINTRRAFQHPAFKNYA